MIVDDLLLEDRRAQRGKRIRGLAVKIPDLLLLAGELARTLDDRARSPPRR
ncbi:MAG: hypothetical protein QM722_01370 [Piscinibacter sp.]